MLWLNRLSLDAPLIAVVWQLLFARALNIHPMPATTFVLAASVWLIYVVDRIFDARKPDAALQPGVRHRFYARNGRRFYVPVAVVLVATAIALTRIPLFVVRDGVIVALAVVAYLGSVHIAPSAAQKYFPKEYASAAIFAAGVTLPFWARMTHADLLELAAITLFCALCFCNTVAIEYWESTEAGRIVAAAPTLWLGPRLVYATALFAIAALTMLPRSRLFFAEAIASIGMFGVTLARKRLPTDLACALVDAALLTPMILLVQV